MNDAVMRNRAPARKTVNPLVEAAHEAAITAVLVFML